MKIDEWQVLVWRRGLESVVGGDHIEGMNGVAETRVEKDVLHSPPPANHHHHHLW